MTQSEITERKLRTKEYYDEISSDYEILHGIGCPGGEFALEHVYWHLLKERLNEAQKVLEFGCGTGKFTQLVSGIAREVIATDISPKMIELARQRVTTENVQFQVADTENLPFGDEQFDAVVGINTFSYCANKKRAMHELQRVLKPGGSVVIIDMNYICPLYHIKGFITPRRYLLFWKELIQSNRWVLTSLMEREGVNVKERFEFLWIPHSSSVSRLSWLRSVDKILSQIPVIRNLSMRVLVRGVKERQ